MSIDDHDIEHLGAGIHLHAAAIDLFVQRGVGAEKELLAHWVRTDALRDHADAEAAARVWDLRPGAPPFPADRRAFAEARFELVRGDDTLAGGWGSDRLVGGTGNDYYVFEDLFGNDTIVEDPSAGTDSMNFGAVTLPLEVRLGSVNVTGPSSGRFSETLVTM
jgi:hypothetical protein